MSAGARTGGHAGYSWDACCALNLLATGRAAKILGTLNAPSYIVRELMDGEVLKLRTLPEDDPAQPLVAADLSIVIDAGAIEPVELTEVEWATFIGLAAEMDDGEARAAALALHRGLCLVTDDRLSLVAVEQAIPFMTTPEWMKHWAESASAPAPTLRECLSRIESRARYRPRRPHSLYSWWMASL